MKLDTFVLHSDELNRDKRIQVLYPEDTNKRYPVLYVHDGETAFRQSTPPGSESLSLDQLSKSNLVIVAIDAEGWEIRTQEYSPFPWIGEAEHFLPSGQEEGDTYLCWLITKLIPVITKRYPVKKGYGSTFMLGCSLGAQISVFASAKYPSVFSKIGCFSLASWGNEPAFIHFLKKSRIRKTTSYFIRVGREEGIPRNLLSLGECYPQLTQDLLACLKEKAIDHVDAAIEKSGRHKTADWEKEIPSFLDWLAH